MFIYILIVWSCSDRVCLCFYNVWSCSDLVISHKKLCFYPNKTTSYNDAIQGFGTTQRQTALKDVFSWTPFATDEVELYLYDEDLEDQYDKKIGLTLSRKIVSRTMKLLEEQQKNLKLNWFNKLEQEIECFKQELST